MAFENYKAVKIQDAIDFEAFVRVGREVMLPSKHRGLILSLRSLSTGGDRDYIAVLNTDTNDVEVRHFTELRPYTGDEPVYEGMIRVADALGIVIDRVW